LEFGPDGDLYALSSSTQQVLRFDGETFAPLGVFCSDALLAGARAMDFGPSGDLFVLHYSGSTKGVRRYAAGTGAIVGQFGSAIGLDDPRDLAFGPDGSAYVTTRQYGNSQTSVWAIDPESGSVLRKFADLGSSQGAHGLLFTDSPGEQPDVTKIIGIDGDGVNALERADGLAVFPDGTAYVSGVDSENVFRIDPDGSITEVLQAPGSGSSSYAALRPDGTVFISVGSAVHEIDPQGGASVVIDSSTVVGGEAIGQLGDIATDLYGNLFVAARSTNRVVKITSSGVRSVVIDGAGDGAGNTLSTPGSLAVGRNGHLYVSGTHSENIFEVEPDGTIRKLLPVPAGPHWLSPRELAVDADGYLYFVSTVNDSVFRRSPKGLVIGVAFDLGQPHLVELAVDKQGRLIVGTSDRVSLITPAREELELIGPGGSGADNQLDVTRAIATDDAGGVYVSTGVGVLRAEIPPDCANGIDDDGDGFVDFPDDPGCFDAQSRENPECDDSVDNDGDGKIDWDGGPHGHPADPQCTEAWRDRERPGSGCGLGAELAFALVMLGRWRHRRDHRLRSR
jgi:DNA-binding beta-propeller fold protein YncE